MLVQRRFDVFLRAATEVLDELASSLHDVTTGELQRFRQQSDEQIDRVRWAIPEEIERRGGLHAEGVDALRNEITVLSAQVDGIAAVKPGVTVDGLHDQMVRWLTESMVRLGLLEGSVDERIADGRRMLADHRDTLASVARRFGVDAETVVAVWGVESDYGRSTGATPLLQSLGTLSCFGRRQTFFRGEFFASLRIVQSGDVPAEHLRGSWAGAGARRS